MFHYKLQNVGTPLGRHGDIHAGISLPYKEAFVINEYTREQLVDDDPSSADLIEQFPDKPGKWRWESRNVIYIPNSKSKQWDWSGGREESEAERIFETIYPAISVHMNHYKDRLKKSINRAELYWEFPSRSILQELERPKIIYRTICTSMHTSMQAAYDTAHRFLSGSTSFIPTTDLSLLAILNSKLFSWYAHRKCRRPKDKRLVFLKRNMVQVPIAPRTETQKEELSNLVQQMLEGPDSFEVPNIEEAIDRLVYELYELTAAEITLIEEESKK